MLVVGEAQPVGEFVVVALFEDESTRVMYTGDNAAYMKETVDNLRLPKFWPSNLGE